MAGNVGNAWQETFLLEITQPGVTLGNNNAEGITETIDWDIGEKDIDQIVVGNGGRLEKIIPEGITTLTLECYPLNVGSGDISAAAATVGFFDLLHAEDGGPDFPLLIRASRARTRVRVAIMWTDDTTADADASDALAAATNLGMRITIADAFVTSVKPTFTDNILKFTIMFKVVPFDSTGTSNIQFESHDGSGGTALPALGSYTTGNKF